MIRIICWIFGHKVKFEKGVGKGHRWKDEFQRMEWCDRCNDFVFEDKIRLKSEELKK